MHSVKLYSFRILKEKGSRVSKVLGDLGVPGNSKITAADILNNYFNAKISFPIHANVGNSIVFIESKNDIKISKGNELIYGYINSGSHGESSEIRDSQLLNKKFKSLPSDITLKLRYFMAYLPSSLEEGLVAIHCHDNTNVSRALFDGIIGYFKSLYNLEVRINPLHHRSIPNYILDADVSKITAVGYKTPSDVADSFNTSKTNIKTDMVIKPSLGVIGKLRDLKNKKISTVFEVLANDSKEIKVTLKIGNRDIVYSYASLIKKGVSIELDDSVLNINAQTGLPSLKELHDEVVSISNQFLLEIHSGNQGVII